VSTGTEATTWRPIPLAYQQRWIEDKTPVKIWLAARQVGKSFALALEAVNDAVAEASDNLILSASERQSRELMRKVHMHLRYLKAATEDKLRAERETREEVVLLNGSRIISLPANPDTVRGFSGNVYLDEFAFHHDAREIWRAMYPAITRGYRIRVTSTPNGRHGMFHDLWSAPEQSGPAVSRHRTDIHDARREGLPVDVEALRRAIGDPEAWAQEFECRFLDEAHAWLPYHLISACESEEAGTVPASTAGDLFLGVDIGRQRDLTVLWLLEEVGDVCHTRSVHVLKREPFSRQREVLFHHLQTVRRAAVDASGIGAQLAEESAERFGPKVESVTFTPAVKESLAVTLRRAFEDRRVRIPADAAIREDLHAVRRVFTPAGTSRFDAARAGGSHADRFWALALALHSAGRTETPVTYEPVDRRIFVPAGYLWERSRTW
jgi:phage FluMu gp28-like protein